jgi:cold shock CspA family protein/ribosome-associated translation inhibitor RaiA
MKEEMRKMDLQIESRNVAMTPRWRREIQQRMEDLQKVYGSFTHGRVTLTKNRHHKKLANVAEAIIVASLPGRRTIAARKVAKTFEEAIRAGFDAVAIKARKHHDKRSRTETRTSPVPPLRGVICKLYPAKGYGFILKEGGGEVYFHKNALHKLSFSELEDGLEVAFDMESGKKGSQATTVNPVPVIEA